MQPTQKLTRDNQNNKNNTQLGTLFRNTQLISNKNFNPTSTAENVSEQRIPKVPTSNNMRDMRYVNGERERERERE
jgi:hypothetical protein